MKVFLSLVLFIFLAVSSQASEFNALLVKNNGDTIRTQIFIKETKDTDLLYSIYVLSDIKYAGVQGDKQLLTPKKFRYFEFTANGITHKFHSLDYTKDDWNESSLEPNKFFHLIYKNNAAISLFNFYDKESLNAKRIAGAAVGGALAGAAEWENMDHAHEISYLLEKQGAHFIVSKDGFKKSMMHYFSDNLELSSKIREGTYTFRDMPLIVLEYNNWYTTK